MLSKRLLFFMLLVLGFCNFALADAITPDTINYANPTQPIVVTKNSSIIMLNLKSNPTTGYAWLLKEYDSNILEPLNYQYYAPIKGRPGAGGYDRWIFKIRPDAFAVPRLTKIVMVYARPWELREAKKDEFKVIIK